MNGKAAEHPFDGYSPNVVPSGEFTLGTFSAVGGHFDVRIEVSGTNQASVGRRYYFGIDYLKLVQP